MPLREHLLEVRKRLFLAALGIVLGAVAGWFLYDPVFTLLQQPLLDAAAENDTLTTTNFGGIATAIDMQIKVSFFIGILISTPWWMYQIWAFVNPGLTSKEKRYAFAFLGAGVPLFLGGAALAWWVLPHAVKILTDFVPPDSANFIDAQLYLSFVMRLVLAFGIAFLLPVIMVALNFLGVVRARTWATGWRWAILIAFVFAAVMTPTPDALTMIWVALPICGLYGIALGICVLHDRRVDRRSDPDEVTGTGTGTGTGERTGTGADRPA
ncbi:twin-arginine translocase subunit TatC [Paraoerskovia sediminicola]|nr:twin-arginine translocase subunit TatC [Paraoerskovia sediminicola]